MAVPRLQDVIVRYPRTDAASDARYLLGLVYYRIGGYRDAIDVFDEYLRLAPKGKYAEESRQYIAQLGREYEDKYVTLEELDRDAQALKEKLAREPADFSLEWQLADLLWRRGNYEEAEALYTALVGRRPEYAQDATFKARLELLPNGRYVALTPAETIRRQNEAQPLVVVNESTFHADRELLTRTTSAYVVTGQIVNRSDSVLYGVQVMITLYGFGNVVYDATTVNIGPMNPKETRAFSVRFSNFENIENIFRHECVPTFQR